MIEIFAGEVVHVPGPHHNKPVQVFVLERLDESLRVCIEVGRTVGQTDGGDSGVPQRPVEGLAQTSRRDRSPCGDVDEDELVGILPAFEREHPLLDEVA